MATYKLDELRMLLRGRMAKLDDSYANAARSMGISDVVLHNFLSGRALSVSMCIRLAKYLGMPANQVLRMAGHTGEATLLEGDVPFTVEPSPPSSNVDALLSGLSEEDKELALDALISIADGLRKRRKRLKKKGLNE